MRRRALVRGLVWLVGGGAAFFRYAQARNLCCVYFTYKDGSDVRYSRARPQRILDLARSLLDRCRQRYIIYAVAVVINQALCRCASHRDEPQFAQTRKPRPPRATKVLVRTERVEAYLDCTCRSSTTYC